MFQIFMVVRNLRPSSIRVSNKILRQRARPMRRGLRAKAHLAQQGSDLPMDGPDGLRVHLNRQVVLLDASNDKNWESSPFERQ